MLTQKRLLMDEEVEGIVHMRSPNMVPSWQPQSSTVHKQQRFASTSCVPSSSFARP